MRFSCLLLICLSLFACGKTGALFLSEEAPEAQPPNAPQQETQAQEQDAGNGGKAD